MGAQAVLKLICHQLIVSCPMMLTTKKIHLAIFLLIAESTADVASVVQSRMAGSTKAETYDRSHPNIVFMLMDDWGYHDLGLRDPHIPTPKIDKLASEGIVMKNFYVTPV